MGSDSGALPPRRRSQIREALDAAAGTWPDDGDPIVVISPRLPWWRNLAAKATPASRRAAVWVWGVATGVLILVIYGWLSSH